MFGKFFASAFTGSMAGAGAHVFATWGYVIANTIDSQVEINPKIVSAMIGCPESDVVEAIDYLCRPDESSRSKLEDGRRIVKEGMFAYRVVNHDSYRSIRDEHDRREYNRLKKREGRSRGVNARVKTKSIDKGVSMRESTVSAQAEAEAEAEAEMPVAGVLKKPTAEKHKRSSIFAKLEPGDLANPMTLADWYRAATHRENPVVAYSQANLLNILGAAVRALRPGKAKKNPVAMFADIVRNARWGDITQADEDVARKQVGAEVLRIAGF